jgi:hypothetical protein
VTVDWKCLVDVRQQHERTAQQHVARERGAFDESHALELNAQQRLRKQHASKAELWQTTSSALAGGGLCVAALRDAGAWSGAIDAQIAQAQQQASEAKAALAERQASLDTARRQLRSAAADTHKAREMQERALKQRTSAQDLQVERRVEENAVHAWATRRVA